MEPTLQGRTALATGANSGVGLELARQLLAQGAEVIVRSVPSSQGTPSIWARPETKAA